MPRKKRRRRFRRKYTYRRRRYRSRGNATEIKFITVALNDSAHLVQYDNAANPILQGNQYYLANLLDNITRGTGYGGRIGNKVYVMKISVKHLIYGCTPSADYVVDRFILRHIWHNLRATAAQTIPLFFGASVKQPFHNLVNRKEVSVHYDNTFMISPGAYATAFTGTANMSGPIRYIQYNVPVNRYVSYTSGEIVREDKNVFSLAMLVATPGMTAATSARQVACSHTIMRIYYKDA